ncbi:MAG: helix-turn-helix domain-containing protein [Stellaceae bacterium]
MARQGVAEDPEADRVLRQFGEELRAARKAAGLTQAQFAKRLGHSQQYVSRVEHGMRNLSVRAMVTIARSAGLVLRLAVVRQNRKSGSLRKDR